MNYIGIGVVLVGNFDMAPPKAEQTDKLVELIRWLQKDYRISRSHVLGHREVGALAGYDWTEGQFKSCPGRYFDMNKLRGYLR
jgi:N-acetyl-anhydromuramyl-L-alanine amidase AmpD